MKKIISFLLFVVMVFSVLAMAGCGKEESLKLGLGVYTSVGASDAEEDKNGQGEATVTAAAVLVNEEGKIVKCVVDCADNKVSYTAEGKAIANDTFKTKYELGYDYNMKKYGSEKEWFEQADAFCALVEGKTITEVKALVADGGKGNADVVNAGCTITVADFVYAIEKAINNAAASNATASNELKLGVSTIQTCKDALEDQYGQNQIETTVFAASIDTEGTIVAAYSDCVQVKFTFDANGVSTFDATAAVSSKRELGDSYNMKLYGGAAKEWYEQVAAFDMACIGKKAGDITSLLGENNYGNADLQAAGCTIMVGGFVEAASKVK